MILRRPSRRPDAPLGRLGPRLSRRGLMTSAVLAGVLAVSGVPLAARARGGTLRLALPGPLPGDWDTRGPALAGLACGLVAETLTEIGPSGELLPALATGWEADGSARDWRLVLSPEARFHDGSPLGPLDVVASLSRHGPGTPMGWLLARVRDLRPDGPHAVRLRLLAGDPDLPLHLAHPRLVVWRGGRPDGVGTGLYQLAPPEDAPRDAPRDAPGGPIGDAPGLYAVRVAAHRRDGRAGFFDAVEVRAAGGPAARLRALLAGAADATGPLPPRLHARAGDVALTIAQAPDGEPWRTLLALQAGPDAAADAVDPAHAATVHAPTLAHGPVSGLGPLDDGRIAERWWRAG